jgi:hypothetical protein
VLNTLYNIYYFFIRVVGNLKLPKIKSLLYIIFGHIVNTVVVMKYKVKKNTVIGVDTTKRETKIIVSLTTFPSRINTVWICIETLLNQTIKPNEIILWLAKEQFVGFEDLPESLLKLQNRGLQIKFCEDLRSHKKYYYTFKEFPKDIIITVDDDVFYPNNMIEELIKLSNLYPDSICCNRGHIIKTDEKGNILPYNSWVHNPTVDVSPSKWICPTGVGGVLYPSNSVNKEVFNQDSIKSLCFFADDLWLKMMSLKNYSLVVKSNAFPYDFFTISSSQKESLGKINVIGNKNDEQLDAILSRYNIKI